MKSIHICGGKPLAGSVNIQGSKNSALPIIAATILNKGTSVLRNCPDIIDVLYMRRILESIGCMTKWEGKTLIINAAEVHAHEIPKEYAETMRSSIIMLGSLLGRTGHAAVSYPGGCVIGARPIDLHLKALEAMQVQITEENGILKAAAPQLTGADIHFAFQSVGATENAILAAVCASGRTILHNCACEPEVSELASFLNAMGADVQGAGTEEIRINGGSRLHDVEYEIVPDRIVAGTYAMAAVGTRGKVTLVNAPVSHLQYLEGVIGAMGGGTCMISGDAIEIDGRAACQPITAVTTMPYPGFPTDMQSQLIAALTRADGVSRVKESIFEARFKAVPALNTLGAHIELHGQEAVIHGCSQLKGNVVRAEELRGGAALVCAGLMSEGETVVANRHFIDRGYEDICRDYKMLGADIR